MYSHVDGDFSYISCPVSPHCLDSCEDPSDYDCLGEFSFSLLPRTPIPYPEHPKPPLLCLIMSAVVNLNYLCHPLRFTFSVVAMREDQADATGGLWACGPWPNPVGVSVLLTLRLVGVVREIIGYVGRVKRNIVVFAADRLTI